MNNIKQALKCAVCDGTGAVLFYDRYGIGDSKPCAACKKAWFENSNKEIAELNAENKQIDAINASLQAHINVLREALEEISHSCQDGIVLKGRETFTSRYIAKQALASTPAQSLVEHNDEVIENYEPDEKQDYITYASRDIRALKGK